MLGPESISLQVSSPCTFFSPASRASLLKNPWKHDENDVVVVVVVFVVLALALVVVEVVVVAVVVVVVVVVINVFIIPT